MTKLLYLEASPRKENSYSSRVAAEFLDAYCTANPDHEIEHLPLFDYDLPKYSAEGADQKMENLLDIRNGGDGIEVVGEWAGVMREVERLKSADKVLLSSAMWNFSVPYRLKHWIDLVVHVGVNVLVNEKSEYIGQITGRPLQMIIASGSPYEERFPLETDGTKTDFMQPYLKHIFRLLGFTDMRTIRVMPMGLPGPKTDEIAVKCKEEARIAALAF